MGFHKKSFPSTKSGKIPHLLLRLILTRFYLRSIDPYPVPVNNPLRSHEGHAHRIDAGLEGSMVGGYGLGKIAGLFVP